MRSIIEGSMARGAAIAALVLVGAQSCTPDGAGGGGAGAPTGEPPGLWMAPIEVCPGAETLDGVDVSSWQGTIDWDLVAGSGIDFAFIRAADGLYQDTLYDENWSEASRVGIVRGTYQFFRPGTDPIEQADLLLGMMGTLDPGDLPPVLDVEDTDGESADVIVANMHAWMDRVEEATGRVPIIYTGWYFWENDVGASVDFVDNPLWIANWGVSCPNTPVPWESWAFWQTSATGDVSGISGDVDTDVFDGDMDALISFASGVPVCGDGHCTGDETHDSCPDDCPICETIPPLGRIVEESEICFEEGGPATSMRHVADDGWGGSLVWTYATDYAERENYGVWHLEFEDAGTYRVEVYTDADYAASVTAPYEVVHAGATDVVELDQSTVDGWQVIGEFEFAAGGDQRIHLPDNTGEPLADHVMIAYDAVSLVRLDPPEADGDGAEDDPHPESGDATTDTGGDASGDPWDDVGPGEGSGCSCSIP